MWKKGSNEKIAPCDANEGSEKAPRAALVVCQHGLLWCSTFVVGATAYTLVTAGLATEVLVTESLLVTSGSVSLLHLMLQNASVYSISRRTLVVTNGRTKTLQKAAAYTLRFSVTAWLLACGLAITFTMARHPHCALVRDSLPRLAYGSTCIVQRTTVAAGLLALLLSATMFILMQRAREPFRSHLCGVLPEQSSLPLMMPYKRSTLPNAMFSEMSFKCRSSSTISSQTLAASFDESTTSLLPKEPEKAVGLRIYTSRSSMPTFLAPRPSLSSIRSHASIHLPPPSSPLPPLPAYLPEKYRQGSAMHRAIHPPQRPKRPTRRPSEQIVRVVPPSPALSLANLTAFNKSSESLSSIYSRSISGERYSPRLPQRPGGSLPESRSFSSSSTATVKRSPLGIMRLASVPEIVFGPQSEHQRSLSTSTDSSIDDVATLQARLPKVETVSEFGEVSGWTGEVSTKHYQKSYEECMGEMEKVDFTPLNITRTRDSAAMFAASAIRAAA